MLRKSDRASRARGEPRLGALVLFAAGVALAGCRESTATVTGLRVVTRWSGVDPRQLAYSLTDNHMQVGQRQVLPPAPQPLSSGADVVIYLRDDLAGHQLMVEVEGLVDGAVVARGEQPVTVARDVLADVEVTLKAGAGEDAGPDSSEPPPDAATDAPADAAPDLAPPDARTDGRAPDAGSDARDAAGDVPAFSQPNGMPCASSTECKSKSCVDGYCCNSACGGLCQSCAVPGAEGICSPVPAGMEDMLCVTALPETCGYDGTCDGKGGCRRFPAGVRCRPGVCGDSAIAAAGACDGDGNCVAGPVIPCAPYRCDGTGITPKCRTTCRDDRDCTSGRHCVQGSCGKKVEGASCAGDVECQSGFCAAGVCCDSRCDGACFSCSLPSSPGLCAPVPVGLKDPRSLCADQGAASCGTNGTCDGRGNCARYPAGAVCHAATCAGPTALASASKCDGLGNCQAGGAVDCAPFACSSGACNGSCAGNGDCAAGVTCMGGSCGKKGLGQPCSAAAQCSSNFCVDGVCCADACTGACRSCSAGVQPGTCTLIASGAADPRALCAPQTAGTCGTDGTCDGSGGCRKYPAGTVCDQPSCDPATNMRHVAATCDGQGSCVPGVTATCAPYRCNGATCFSACSGNGDCAAPNVCVGGSCSLQPPGAACQTGPECSTGTCTDGVCCQAMSCGACNACNVPGSLGVCAPVADGAPDPRKTCPTEATTGCGFDGKCDGAGACRKYPASTVCGSAQCTADSVSVVLAPHCDGKGSCSAGATQSCAPYTCDGAANACRTKCTAPGDCASPNICSAKGTCGDRQPLGAACQTGLECASGNCVDKVCCSSASCGSCQACNVASSMGSCAPVGAGVVDPAGVCSATPASGCGTDGTCDGAGNCRQYPAGTVCAAASCAANIATPASTCNGSGACVPPGATIDCDTYACAAGACKTTCTVDGDCFAPNTCVGSTCRLKPPGAACTGDAQCGTGHCTDGVCCDSGPCGSCRACNVPGFLGFCHVVGAGVTDPAGVCVVEPVSTCGTDGKCDGNGACRNYPQQTVCNPGSCTGRTFTRPDQCDGNGKCIDRGTRSCDPYVCNPATAACYNGCTGNAQCSGGNKCIGGNCI